MNSQMKKNQWCRIFKKRESRCLGRIVGAGQRRTDAIILICTQLALDRHGRAARASCPGGRDAMRTRVVVEETRVEASQAA